MILKYFLISIVCVLWHFKLKRKNILNSIKNTSPVFTWYWIKTTIPPLAMVQRATNGGDCCEVCHLLSDDLMPLSRVTTSLTSGGGRPKVHQLLDGPASATVRDVQRVRDTSPLSPPTVLNFDCDTVWCMVLLWRQRQQRWRAQRQPSSSRGACGPVAPVAHWPPWHSSGRLFSPEPRQRVKCHGTVSWVGFAKTSNVSVSQSQGPVVTRLWDVGPDTVASYSETDQCVNAQQWPKNNREEPAASSLCLSVTEAAVEGRCCSWF